MLLETKIAIAQGVCEKEYGQRLLALIERALQVKPLSAPDFSDIKNDAERAKSDKKNADDHKIKMSVAKAKGEWTLLSLPFDEYVSVLETAAKN